MSRRQPGALVVIVGGRSGVGDTVVAEDGPVPVFDSCLLCGTREETTQGACSSCAVLLRPLAACAAPDACRGPLRDALDIELGGVAFYQQGERLATTPETRSVYRCLANMEEEHLRRLCWRHQVRPEPPRQNGQSLARLSVYGNTTPPLSDPAEVLKLAVSLEERAREYFAERRDETDVGSPERELYAQLEAEEREHIAQLSQRLERCPKS